PSPCDRHSQLPGICRNSHSTGNPAFIWPQSVVSGGSTGRVLRLDGSRRGVEWTCGATRIGFATQDEAFLPVQRACRTAFAIDPWLPAATRSPTACGNALLSFYRASN